MNGMTVNPILGLDHLCISVADLATEAANYEVLFGAAPVWSGTLGDAAAVVFTSSNVALCLRQTKGATGLERVCFRVDTLSRMRRRLARVGVSLREDLAPDPLAELEGATQAGVVLADSPSVRGLSIGFVSRESSFATSINPRVHALDHLVISSTQAQGTAFLLAAQLGLDMRLDMQRPEWGARMMFFRCGDLILEVVQKLDESPQNCAKDSFFGLSWRVANANAVQSALAEAGFDVSNTRPGRKPGTTVFTLRNKNAGVATLLLELKGAY